MSPLVDRCSRRLNYLRVSITDRCNLHCTYCMPDERVRKLRHEDILTYEEILRVLHIGTTMGITKVRITGGEPLVRKGVVGFIGQVCAMPALEDVSLTTNGVLLAPFLADLQSAGIRRINISLDTLNAVRYRAITGVDGYSKVWRALMNALEMGFSPIKINVVVMRGVNDAELADLARLSIDYPFHVRFIEHMPIGKASVTDDVQMLVPEMRTIVEAVAPLEAVPSGPHDGPAQRFRFPDGAGEIGFISSISNHFCATCNRLRLTARGSLRPCLLSDREVDLRMLLRSGAADQAVCDAFTSAVSLKGADHGIGPDRSHGPSGHMSAIGG
jgi:cyclic pyranopterin phosphate synthase